MKKIRFTALLLLSAVVLGAFAGCIDKPGEQTHEATGDITEAGTVVTQPLPIDTEPSGTEAVTEAQTEADTTPAPGEPGYVIPEETLSGKNEKSDPAEDDGDGAAILARLIKESMIKNADAKADKLVSRVDFAYDIAYCSGFMGQQSAYICMNDYTDMEKYSAEMRRAPVPEEWEARGWAA